MLQAMGSQRVTNNLVTEQPQQNKASKVFGEASIF